jgi:hypothetical protein
MRSDVNSHTEESSGANRKGPRVGGAKLAAKGGFQAGQPAKARSGRRVQSLPIRAMAAYTFLMS